PSLLMMIGSGGRYLDPREEKQPARRRKRIEKMEAATDAFEQKVRVFWEEQDEEWRREALAELPFAEFAFVTTPDAHVEPTPSPPRPEPPSTTPPIAGAPASRPAP